MKKLRYGVAASLDGFIAGPNGEVDWIIIDPSIDFQSIFDQFDTLIMGRSTYEVTKHLGGMMSDMTTVVCSSTLKPEDHPDVQLTTDAASTAQTLKQQAGKDIWLYGGGRLFRSLLEAELVDTIELALIPVMLGNGIPLIAEGKLAPTLRLTQNKTLETGTIMLTYDIEYPNPIQED